MHESTSRQCIYLSPIPVWRPRIIPRIVPRIISYAGQSAAHNTEKRVFLKNAPEMSSWSPRIIPRIVPRIISYAAQTAAHNNQRLPIWRMSGPVCRLYESIPNTSKWAPGAQNYARKYARTMRGLCARPPSRPLRISKIWHVPYQ